MKNKNLISLFVWISGFVFVGYFLGVLTKPAIHTWYTTLHRSLLTPPDYLFGIVWTFLYILIALCGWTIWQQQQSYTIGFIKHLYVWQVVLNWSWSPLFFMCQMPGIALASLLIMDLLTLMIILYGYKNLRAVSLLMIPYLLWILFATYLNFYIWYYN